MDDLRTRFRRFDRLEPPDLWREALLRSDEAAPATSGSLRPAYIVLLAALLLAALAAALAVATSPRPDVVQTAPRLVAYMLQTGVPFDHETRIWVAQADGSEARTLVDDAAAASLVGWMPDGAGLLYKDRREGLSLVGLDGAVGSRWPADVICPDPCRTVPGYGFALSPDGTRVAFVRQYGDGDDSVVTIMVLADGTATELESTRTTNVPLGACMARSDDPACQGRNEDPVWSPDGTRLAFTRWANNGETGGVFVVDTDGSGLRQVHPAGSRPRWSPDGGAIAFQWLDDVGGDVYTMKSDGSNLARLTRDGVSWVTSWTLDGRIAFVRIIGGNEIQTWVMDADGRNAERIPQTLESLTRAGCAMCIYPDILEAHWGPLQSPPAAPGPR